ASGPAAAGARSPRRLGAARLPAPAPGRRLPLPPQTLPHVSGSPWLTPPPQSLVVVLVLQSHLLELRRNRPALLVVAAFGERLVVAAVGGPLPDPVRADGMAAPGAGEEAPDLGYRKRQDRYQARVGRDVGGGGGGTRAGRRGPTARPAPWRGPRPR